MINKHAPLVSKILNFVQSLPQLYRHLSIMDSSLGPKESKLHTNSTSIILSDTSLFWPILLVPKRSNLQTIIASTVQPTPLYHRLFSQSQRDQTSYNDYLYGTDNSVMASSFGFNKNIKLQTITASLVRSFL